jgi:hypothetical protein
MKKLSEDIKEFFPYKRLRQIVSLGALLVALAHVIWPNLAIDAITLVLIMLAIIPWLAPLIKSLELPGGLKLEFQELQAAGIRAESAGLLSAKPSKKGQEFSFQSISEQDPNLALAGLRIEIEKRLSTLASVYKINNAKGVRPLLNALTENEVLTNEERSILSDMVNMLNAAVHGAIVDKQAAQWAISTGPRLLISLDERVKLAKPRVIKQDKEEKSTP